MEVAGRLALLLSPRHCQSAGPHGPAEDSPLFPAGGMPRLQCPLTASDQCASPAPLLLLRFSSSSSSFLSFSFLSSSSCSYFSLSLPEFRAWAAAAGRALPPPHPPPRTLTAAAAVAGLPAGASAAGLRLLTPPPRDLGAESPGLGLPRATVIFSPRLSCRHLRPGETLSWGERWLLRHLLLRRDLSILAHWLWARPGRWRRARTHGGWRWSGGGAVVPAGPACASGLRLCSFVSVPFPHLLAFSVSTDKSQNADAGLRMLANSFSISPLSLRLWKKRYQASNWREGLGIALFN